MATTFTLISGNTLSTASASVIFSSIPATYDDLLLNISARTDDTGGYYNNIRVKCNAATGTYSGTIIYANGADGAGSLRSTGSTLLPRMGYADGPSSTASTFSNIEIYLPQYKTSLAKQISAISVTENNQTNNMITSMAGNLWSGSTAAITTLTISTDNNFVANSTFWLYGIKNS